MKKIASSGMTLIELLIVIAVIALIAAILFPSFAGAREKARQSGCISNLKQSGLAWIMYAQDYDGSYVIDNYYTEDGTYNTWYGVVNPANQIVPGSGMLAPYTTGAHQIYDCPSESLQPVFDGPGGKFGYAVNERIHPSRYKLSASASEQVHSVTDAEITSPSDTIVASDSAELYLGITYSYLDLYTPSNTTYFPTSHALHHDRCDILWFDGHVKSISISSPDSPDGLGNTPEDMRANHIGYVLPPNCILGDTSCEDYYYQITKP